MKITIHLELRSILTALCLGGVLCSAPLHAAQSSISTADARPGSLVLLLGGDNVREALGVTAKQERSLDALRSEFRDQAREAVGGAGGAARAEKLSKVTAAYDAKALSVLSAEQRSKLRMIEAQAVGPWALTATGVQNTLGLSPAQRAQIAEIAVRMDARVDLANQRARDGEISYARRVSELRAARKSLGRDIDSVLTPAQRAQYGAMLSGSQKAG